MLAMMFVPTFERSEVVCWMLVAMVFPAVFALDFLANTKSFVRKGDNFIWFKYSHIFGDRVSNRIVLSDILTVEFKKDRYVINLKDSPPMRIDRDLLFAFKGHNRIISFLEAYRKNASP
jgi:hypothetical protein